MMNSAARRAQDRRGGRSAGRGRSGGPRITTPALRLTEPELGEQSPYEYSLSAFTQAGANFNPDMHEEITPIQPTGQVIPDEYDDPLATELGIFTQHGNVAHTDPVNLENTAPDNPSTEDLNMAPIAEQEPHSNVYGLSGEAEPTSPSTHTQSVVDTSVENSPIDAEATGTAGQSSNADNIDSAAPAPVNIPEFSIGEASAINESEEQVPTVPNALPAIETVLGRTPLSSSLVNSDLLGALGAFSHETLTQAGPYRLVTTSTHRIIDPYNQMVMAVIGRRYAHLPAAPYDEATLTLLHYIVSCYRGTPERLSRYNNILHRYQEISGESFDEILNEVGQVIMRPLAESERGFANLPDATEFNALLTELQTVYPEVVTAYNMAFQIVRNGLECLNEISVLIPFDSGLSSYINAIASGTRRIRASDVNSTIRPLHFRTAPEHIESGIPIDGSPHVEVEYRAAQTQARGVTRGVGSNARSGQINRPNQLLAQGNPPPVQVQRDTTRFRQSVDEAVHANTRFDALSSDVDTLQIQVVQLQNEVRTLNERLNAMDLSFTTYISRISQADLNNRVNINRTLVQPVDTEHRAAAMSAPARTSMSASIQSNLIARIENFQPGHDAAALAREVQSAYIAAGETNAAASIIPDSFKFAFSRARICERLRGFPSSS